MTTPSPIPNALPQTGPLVEQELYPTSDKQMVMVLLCFFKPVQVGLDDHGQLSYTFRKTDVTDLVMMECGEPKIFKSVSVDKIVKMIQRGHADELMFTFRDSWTAEATWQMNLRHYRIPKGGRGNQ